MEIRLTRPLNLDLLKFIIFTQIFITLFQQPVLDLAECLTILGFANVNGGPNDVHDKNLQRYYENLIRLQNKAKRTRAGLWADK